MLPSAKVLGLFFAALFIVLNGFFVAAEFALVKVNATQLGARVKEGDKRAAAAQAIVSRIDRYLSVTQLGITLASLGLGWIGEPAIEHVMESLIQYVHPGEPGKALKLAGVIVAFAILTFSHVLFGELVPKLIAIQRSEGVAMRVAFPLRVIYITFRPLLFILETATGVILRAMGLSSDAASEGTLSEEEILGILVTNASRTPSGKGKSELIERVVRFSQRTARHAMVPRVDVAYLPIDTPGGVADEKLRNLQYSRIVLTKSKSLDEVAGYLYAKDFFLLHEPEKMTSLESLRRDVLFVPEPQSLLDVLRSMQSQHTMIAVVVDEYGGTSGIVTMEDLLEEIVGEIRDEFDDEQPLIASVQNKPREFDVDASANMEELRTIGIVVSEEDAPEAIGSVFLDRLGRMPRRGDSVDLGGGVMAVVTALAKRRVTSVRVRLPDPITKTDEKDSKSERVSLPPTERKGSIPPTERKRSERPPS